MRCSCKSGKIGYIFNVDNAKGTSPSRIRLSVAITKTSPKSTLIASSICSVVSVGIESNSSKFDLLAVDVLPVLVINDTTSPKQ